MRLGGGIRLQSTIEFKLAFTGEIDVTDVVLEKLRVFLSWSQPRSEAVAQTFRDWLPSVLQNVQPYYTADDISKGARWAGEIRGELEASDFGIIFLTRENLGSPWILFEAGALSKLEKSRVAPLLLDLEPTDVSGPLAQLQLTKFNRDECAKLLKSINRELGPRGLEASVLNNVFDKWWPDLEAKVQAAIALPSPSQTAPRPERELLEEVLERVRAIQMRPQGIHPGTYRPRSISLRELRLREGPNDVQISELGLSDRTRITLKQEGIKTLGDVLSMTPIDLLKVPNFGKSSLVDLTTVLERYGLCLSVDKPTESEG